MLSRWWAVSAVLVLTGCGMAARKEAASLTGGDPANGAAAISRYGCGSCHTIPGISGAHGQVGPSLAGIVSRVYIAGKLENQPLNVERWVRDPHSVDERTVMPNLGVSLIEATDITAYLYSLK